MIDHDLRDIMQTEGGRRFIYRLLQSCGTDNAAFIVEPYASAYHTGRRSVGVEVLSSIRKMPDGWDLELIMRKEARAQPKEAKEETIYDKTY